MTFCHIPELLTTVGFLLPANLSLSMLRLRSRGNAALLLIAWVFTLAILNLRVRGVGDIGKSFGILAELAGMQP